MGKEWPFFDLPASFGSPKVHVQLLVAMKKGQPRIVGNEIDFCFLITSQHEHIFEDSSLGLSCDPGELETVPVKMNRVNVIAGVPRRLFQPGKCLLVVTESQISVHKGGGGNVACLLPSF